MPAGRPSSYKPGICGEVIEHGREGMGRHEIAAELDIAWGTLQNWEKAHPEFLAATTRARELAAGWWAKQGRLGITSREFNANAYRLQVMNRFPDDWRDKHELEHKGGIVVNIESKDADL